MRVRSPLPAPVFPLFSRLGAVSFRPLFSRNSIIAWEMASAVSCVLLIFSHGDQAFRVGRRLPSAWHISPDHVSAVRPERDVSPCLVLVEPIARTSVVLGTRVRVRLKY